MIVVQERILTELQHGRLMVSNKDMLMLSSYNSPTSRKSLKIFLPVRYHCDTLGHNDDVDKCDGIGLLVEVISSLDKLRRPF